MAGWHTRAIIYQIDTALFYDLNGDATLHPPDGRDGYLDHSVLPHAFSR